ncbi:MAG: ATP-binding protein [Cyclobacteriaceae bacterium]
MDNQAGYLQPTELLEHINDAFFGLNAQWSFTYLNRAAEVLLAHTKEELLGRRIWDAFPEAVGSTFYMKYHEAIAEDKEVAFTEFYRPLDSWFFVKAYPVRDKGLLVFFNNINDLKQAEQKLRQSENTFRTLFDNMTIGVVYQSSTGEITATNPAAERILGLSLDELTGRVSADPRWRALDEKGMDLPGEKHPSHLALNFGRPVIGFHMQVYNPRLNSFRWLLVDAVPQFREGEEAPFQVFTLFRDITDRQQALADQEEMMHMIAHDLRNPVSSALVLADIISDRLEEANISLSEEILYLKKALLRTSHLMDDMIDSVRLETGGLEIDTEKVQAETFLNDLNDTQRPLVESAGLQWDLRVHTNGGLLQIAPHRMHQVFENLISNAIKFTPVRGTITLKAYTQDEHIVFELSDTGLGISEDHLDKIFDKYWQKSKTRGSGLGLYIVKKIVEAHRGSISVESKLSGGTRFRIRLPLAE